MTDERARLRVYSTSCNNFPSVYLFAMVANARTESNNVVPDTVRPPTVSMEAVRCLKFSLERVF